METLDVNDKDPVTADHLTCHSLKSTGVTHDVKSC